MKLTTLGFALTTAGTVFLAGSTLAQGSAADVNGGAGRHETRTDTGAAPVGQTPRGSGSTSPGVGTGTSSDTSGASAHASALQGKVQSFDRSNNTLVLAGSAKTLKIDSTTQVRRDGARASVGDIKEGDQVRASFAGAGDTLNVSTLDILAAGTTAGASNSGTGSGAAAGGVTGSSGSAASSASGGSGSRSDSAPSTGTGATGSGSHAGSSTGTDTRSNTGSDLGGSSTAGNAGAAGTGTGPSLSGTRGSDTGSTGSSADAGAKDTSRKQGSSSGGTSDSPSGSRSY